MSQSKMATSTSILGKRSLSTTTVELPFDLWGVVCSFLPFAGIYNLGLSCKSLREVFLSRGMKELKKQFTVRVEKYFKEQLQVPYVTPEQLLEFVYFFEKSWFTGGFLWSVLLGETWPGGDIDVIGECDEEWLETRTYGDLGIQVGIIQIKDTAMLNVHRKADELIPDSVLYQNIYFEGMEGIAITRSIQSVKCLKWFCNDTEEGLPGKKIADFIACLPGGLKANIQAFDMEGCMSTYNLKELHVVSPGNTLLGRTTINRTYEELAKLEDRYIARFDMPYRRLLKYKKRGITFVNPLPRDPQTGLLPRCLRQEEEDEFSLTSSS